MDAKALTEDRNRDGAVVENCVAIELVKQISWIKTRPTLHNFCDVSGNEVHFVMEAPDDRIIGIKVKCSSYLGTHDWRGQETLPSLVGEDFVQGIILYTGPQRLASGKTCSPSPLAARGKRLNEVKVPS